MARVILRLAACCTRRLSHHARPSSGRALSMVTVRDHLIPAELSSCRLYRRSMTMPVARPRPNVALVIPKFLLAKSGVDDQDQSSSTAERHNAAASMAHRPWLRDRSRASADPSPRGHRPESVADVRSSFDFLERERRVRVGIRNAGVEAGHSNSRRRDGPSRLICLRLDSGRVRVGQAAPNDEVRTSQMDSNRYRVTMVDNRTTDRQRNLGPQASSTCKSSSTS